MNSYVSVFVGTFAFAALASLSGCAGSTDKNEWSTSDRGARIIDGQPAFDYPESATIDMSRGGQLAAYCSGTLIAPQVVLTAGHCVASFDGWDVTLPFAGNQKAHASSASTTYSSTGEQVNGNSIDVGLVFLDTPLSIGTFPDIAASPVADGTSVINTGRIVSSFVTGTVFKSPPVAVVGAADVGFPLDYRSVVEIEPGDSGGGDFIDGTHTIVAVNSGASSNLEVLARVDLAIDFIRQGIASHGGPAPGH